MSGPLEKFIWENRDKFDAEAPAPEVWEKIRDRVMPGEKEKPIRYLPFKRWLSAAAVVILTGLTVLLYHSLQPTPKPSMAGTNAIQTEPSHGLPQTGKDTQALKVETDAEQTPKNKSADPTQKTADNAENKEMYYYAKLIEIKHEELKTLQKDEPLLYKQFSADVQKLDSVYHSLKIQLPKNSNREQLMEAMISNLQLQIGLLNRQLKIIKQIKHSKKTAYEKAYQSV